MDDKDKKHLFDQTAKITAALGLIERIGTYGERASDKEEAIYLLEKVRKEIAVVVAAAGGPQ